MLHRPLNRPSNIAPITPWRRVRRSMDLDNDGPSKPNTPRVAGAVSGGGGGGGGAKGSVRVTLKRSLGGGGLSGVRMGLCISLRNRLPVGAGASVIRAQA